MRARERASEWRCWLMTKSNCLDSIMRGRRAHDRFTKRHARTCGHFCGIFGVCGERRLDAHADRDVRRGPGRWRGWLVLGAGGRVGCTCVLCEVDVACLCGGGGGGVLGMVDFLHKHTHAGSQTHELSLRGRALVLGLLW